MRTEITTEEPNASPEKAPKPKSGSSDRLKLIGLLSVIILGLAWIVYQIVPDLFEPSRYPITQSLAWDVATNLNVKISEIPEFSSVHATVDDDAPTVIVIRGSVRSQNDLAKLQTHMKEWGAEENYRIEVEILPK